MTTQRVHAGVPTGGQFAGRTTSEADIELENPGPDSSDTEQDSAPAARPPAVSTSIRETVTMDFTDEQRAAAVEKEADLSRRTMKLRDAERVLREALTDTAGPQFNDAEKEQMRVTLREVGRIGTEFMLASDRARKDPAAQIVSGHVAAGETSAGSRYYLDSTIDRFGRSSPHAISGVTSSGHHVTSVRNLSAAEAAESLVRHEASGDWRDLSVHSDSCG